MSELALRLIEKAYVGKATFLDLGNCALQEIPKEIIKLKDTLLHLNLGTHYRENGFYKRSANKLDANVIGDNDHSLFMLREFPHLQSLFLFDNGIGQNGLGYLDQLKALSVLDVGNNKIDDKGIVSLLKLTSLRSLAIQANKFTLEGVKIFQGFKSLTSLLIGFNKLGNKGAEYISKLTSLTELDLAQNDISQEGVAHLSKLTSLVKLELAHNDIRFTGANYLNQLTSLKYLDLSGCNIDNNLIGFVCTLPSITSLKLNYNVIGVEGAWMLSRLSGLTYLHLRGNAIENQGARHISKLTNLTSLDVSSNDLGDKGVEFISKLSNLTTLRLANNSISDAGVTFLEQLPVLAELDLSENRIQKFDAFPTGVWRKVNLRGNLIKNISVELLKNVPLEISLFEDNNVSENCLFIDGVLIENIPREVLVKGRKAILEYLEGDDLRSLNECKLIFVGDGGVGKTSLMKRLVYEKFKEGEITTHGINKIAWKGIVNEEQEPVNVNCWDFGGQHIQHSLHQFFFSERVVYVLVLNPRNDEKAGYWLDQIDQLGRNSQLIIVYNWKNKEDVQADYLRNFRELRKTYKYLPEPITLSCAGGDGMAAFRTAVRTAVLANDGLKIKYPRPWFNIKEKLQTRIPIEKHYIEYSQYEAWCSEENYNDPEQCRNLLRILDSVGAIVFFDKPVLNELQVLNPEWITTGAYAILTSEITNEKKGHLTWNDLRKIFSTEKEIYSDKKVRIKYEEPQFKFILQLMVDYWLCQENPLVKHEYLIPVAFGEKPKEYDVEGARHYRFKFQSNFEMLIIHRFIAKNILNIVSNDYWNSGIYFKHASSATYALVETNLYSQQIDCWIKGYNVRGMWEVIRNDFREIFNMYHNFPVDEEVEYIDGEQAVFLKYGEMLDALKNDVPIIPYDPKTGLKNIFVLEVLELFGHREIFVAESAKKRSEFNPQIIVSPQFNNNPVITVSPQVMPEAKKEQASGKTYDVERERSLVKKWKNKALISFACSSVITIVLVMAWSNKWWFSLHAWYKLEKNELIKWAGIILGLLWNGFIIKSLYDRFLDPSKEKAYREGLRK